MDLEIEVLREVPDTLQRLVRFVVRGFFGIEHGLVIDVLVRNPCVKEDDILELLKYDKKQLRVILNQLKNDKFLKSRPYVETHNDGKSTKHNYYYINYRSVANIIKYKLHHMHKRIETRERDLTNRPNFKCPTCQNTYSDLEVNQLIDPVFGTLNCTFCATEVVEDKEAVPDEDNRTSQARFNEQMEPVYKLLKEVENVNLSVEVLEPKPTIIPHIHPNKSGTTSKQRSDDFWSHGRNAQEIDIKQDVTINIGNEKKGEEKPKEMPGWLTQSTVMDQSSASIDQATNNVQSTEKISSQPINNEVLQTLLVQERSKIPTPSYSQQSAPKEESDSDDFEDVEDDAGMMLEVGGTPYHYEDIVSRGEDLIKLMTPQEKARYIEVGQRMYEEMEE